MTDAVLQGRRHVIRSRVARLRAAHSYRTVLILIVAAFAFVSLAGDATWTAGVLLVLEAATLAVAVWTSGVNRATSRGLIALHVVKAAPALTNLYTEGERLKDASGF